MGQIARKKFINGEYIYKIDGPIGGVYRNIKESKIIRIITQKELEAYRIKIVTKDTNNKSTDMDPIIDHKMYYSNC